jgi:hypothetical protein
LVGDDVALKRPNHRIVEDDYYAVGAFTGKASLKRLQLIPYERRNGDVGSEIPEST